MENQSALLTMAEVLSRTEGTARMDQTILVLGTSISWDKARGIDPSDYFTAERVAKAVPKPAAPAVAESMVHEKETRVKSQTEPAPRTWLENLSDHNTQGSENDKVGNIADERAPQGIKSASSSATVTVPSLKTEPARQKGQKSFTSIVDGVKKIFRFTLPKWQEETRYLDTSVKVRSGRKFILESDGNRVEFRALENVLLVNNAEFSNIHDPGELVARLETENLAAFCSSYLAIPPTFPSGAPVEPMAQGQRFVKSIPPIPKHCKTKWTGTQYQGFSRSVTHDGDGDEHWKVIWLTGTGKHLADYCPTKETLEITLPDNFTRYPTPDFKPESIIWYLEQIDLLAADFEALAEKMELKEAE